MLSSYALGSIIACSLTLINQSRRLKLQALHLYMLQSSLYHLFIVLCFASARELVLSASSTSNLAQPPEVAETYQAKPNRSGIGAKWKGGTCGHTAKGKFRTCLDQVATCLLMCSNWYKEGVSTHNAWHYYYVDEN